MDSKKLKQVADDIHQNAVDHGWWEKERSKEEIFALIHSELSEAVEEVRKGTPPMYVKKWRTNSDECEFEFDIIMTIDGYVEYHFGKKPEGELIELADVIIRILDYLSQLVNGFEFYEEIKANNIKSINKQYKFGIEKYVEYHSIVSEIFASEIMDEIAGMSLLIKLIEHISGIEWGLDLWDAVYIKHEYNKTRPYKHGGKLF